MPYKNKRTQKLYQKKWAAERYHRERNKWIKENGPCVNCGSWEDLHLDHIDRQGKLSHRIWSWSKEKREAEISKCQALCIHCHIDKTVNENKGELPSWAKR